MKELVKCQVGHRQGCCANAMVCVSCGAHAASGEKTCQARDCDDVTARKKGCIGTDGVIFKRKHNLYELRLPMDLGRVVAFGHCDAVLAAARLICGENWRHADMYEQVNEQMLQEVDEEILGKLKSCIEEDLSKQPDLCVGTK